MRIGVFKTGEEVKYHIHGDCRAYIAKLDNHESDVFTVQG
jgi:hypothetical protein